MALENLSNLTENLNLEEPHHLLFEPQQSHPWLMERFDAIPRYLFRITTPNSDGTTDECWVKSKDAMNNLENQYTDIFAENEPHVVAAKIARHLRWRGEVSDLDNLVSWTSSLLFAMQYIFYRHNSPKDNSRLEDIYLCVIDTSLFHKQTFIEDMGLINAYKDFDDRLEDLSRLRQRKHRCLTGTYYFGEYLSQGALRIENKCRLVSAKKIIDGGLFTLQPEFQRSLDSRDTLWASEVIRLRECFYSPLAERPEITLEEVKAARRIGELFGLRWRLPLVAYFMALRPRKMGDKDISAAFAPPNFADYEIEKCSPLKTKISAYNTLPEVEQFRDILRSAFEDFYFRKLKDYVKDIESRLQSATTVFDRLRNYSDALPWQRENREHILQRTRQIESMSISLREMVEKSNTNS